MLITDRLVTGSRSDVAAIVCNDLRSSKATGGAAIATNASSQRLPTPPPPTRQTRYVTVRSGNVRSGNGFDRGTTTALRACITEGRPDRSAGRMRLLDLQGEYQDYNLPANLESATAHQLEATMCA